MGSPWPADAWVVARAPLETCRRGIHACRPQALPFWIDAELWEVELDGRILAEQRKLVAERGVAGGLARKAARATRAPEPAR